MFIRKFKQLSSALTCHVAIQFFKIVLYLGCCKHIHLEKYNFLPNKATVIRINLNVSLHTLAPILSVYTLS